METAEQAEGEKQVRRVLVEPLERRGLARPTSLTKAAYDAMVDDLCQRLAYMSAGNLAALEEQAAAHPGGKDKDRVPIANNLLKWAAEIQPPGDDASPLIRAVFAHGLGQDALMGGWAPELLGDLKKNRRWPGGFAIKGIRERADEPVRQMAKLDERLARGATLTEQENQWRQRRMAALDRCRRIAEMAERAEA